MVIVTTFQQPESPVVLVQADTRVILNNRDLGSGTIYVSERNLSWKEQGGRGFSMGIPDISLHATSTDPNVHPTACVMIVVDGAFNMPEAYGETPLISRPNMILAPDEDSDNDENEEAQTGTSELLLIPADPSAVHSIYSALNHCQALNNDDDLLEEEDNVYEDAEDYAERFESNDRINDLGAGGDSDMTHLSVQLQNLDTNRSTGNGDQNVDDDQFVDAD